jgi:hypothetical protein
MFEDFLNHRCNIYHLEDESVDIGYGIKEQNVKKPSAIPSEKEVPCHFHIVKSNSVMIVQGEPFAKVVGEVKLSLPIDTDIRDNDTVEDCKNGIKYRASIPNEVHGGHHITVTLFRENGTGAAI